jgi:hypothetical protein
MGLAFEDAESLFLAIIASLHWLNNVSGIYLIQVSLLLIGQNGSSLPIGWRIVQILRQQLRKTSNTAPTTLGAIKASSQSTFINVVKFNLNLSHDTVPFSTVY